MSRADVETVIAELRDEFHHGGARGDGGGVRDMPRLASVANLRVDASRLKGPDGGSDAVAALSSNFDVRRFEARLAGLEQTTSAILNVMNQLLQAVRVEPQRSENKANER